MKKLMKMIFCKHEFDLVSWHWNRSMFGDPNNSMIATYKCSKCGRYRKLGIPQKSAYESFLLNNRPYLQTSKIN